MPEPGKMTLLLVDDEAIIALAGKMALEQFGYAVQTVNSGEKAVEAVKTRLEIDLVLMDIDLGDGIDGTQAAKTILKTRDIPIVFVSSHSEREVVEKTEKLTSYGYIVKNTSVTVLDASIKMAFKLFDADRNLKMANEKLKATFEALPDLIFELDLDGRYYESRSSTRELLYKPLPDLLGKKISDVLPADAAHTVMAAIAEANVKGLSVDKSYELTVPAGTRTFEIIVSRIAGFSERPRFIMLCRDVTERKNAEETLRENENKYRLLAEYSSDIIFSVDENGIYQFVNEYFASTAGKQTQDIIGKSFWDIYPKENADARYDIVKRAFKSGEKESFEISVPLQGKMFYYSSKINPIKDKTGKVFLAVVYGKDITDRKAEEAARKESEERYRLLIENSRDIIYVADLEGVFSFVSSSWQSLLGHPVDQVTGKSFQEFVHPDDIAACLSWLGKLIKTGQCQDGVEYRVRHLDGSWRWHASSAVPLKDDSGTVTGFEGTARDITERRQAEAARRDSESNYLSLFNTVKQAIYVQNPDLTFVDVNQGVVDMYGYGKEFFIGKTPAFLSAPNRNDLMQIAEYIRLAFEGHPQKFEFWGIKKDGTVFPKEVWTVKGKYFGKDVVITMANDISDRKQKEAALKESQERRLFALEGSALGEWDWNFKTDKVKRNERWAGMLGYSLEEIDDNLQQSADLQHPDDREGAWNAVRDHLSGSTDSYNILYRMRAKDGTYKWIHDCGKIMERDDQGNPLRLCGTHADVTDQKEKEEKIKSLLLEKELMLKEVHHRIKNNLNTVGSLLSLQSQMQKETSAVAVLEDAGNRIRSMSLLYDKLYRSPDFTNVSVADYLPALVDEIIGNFPNSGSVKVEKHFEDFALDSKRLQPLGIIINELLTNTMKYAFSGRNSGLIVVSALHGKGRVSIAVRDDGVGIPDSVSFDDLSGFGFQLIKALTQQLNGSIRLERGNGTKVVLEFGI